MYLNRKVTDDCVAVAKEGIEAPLGIFLRKSGKKYYGTEEPAVYMYEGKLIINKPVAEKYGLQVVVRGE